jgi:hypothetical protein
MGDLLQLERIGRIEVTKPIAWNWWIARQPPVLGLRQAGRIGRGCGFAD